MGRLNVLPAGSRTAPHRAVTGILRTMGTWAGEPGLIERELPPGGREGPTGGSRERPARTS